MAMEMIQSVRWQTMKFMKLTNQYTFIAIMICLSFHPSVDPSVGLSVGPSVTKDDFHAIVNQLPSVKFQDMHDCLEFLRYLFPFFLFVRYFLERLDARAHDIVLMKVFYSNPRKIIIKKILQCDLVFRGSKHRPFEKAIEAMAQFIW